jgi:hypothetical protein
MRLRQFSRKGQSIVVVALGLVGLVALVALGVDGGSALLQRRNMQNGADSGALAAIQLISQGDISITCVDRNGVTSPCHPFYLTAPSQGSIYQRANQLVQSNQGGVIGTAAPVADVWYHMVAGAPGCDAALNPSGCFSQSSNNPNDTTPIPEFADGVKVIAMIDNPTTFLPALKVVGVNLTTVRVAAAAAQKIYGTCAPAQVGEVAAPWTRFRPQIEGELERAANDPYHPYDFWQSHADIQGNSNSNWKNTISLSTNLYNTTGTQSLAAFDCRQGLPGTAGCGNTPNGVGPNWGTSGPCTALNTSGCANMQGNPTGGSTAWVYDQQNWLYYHWNGQIAIPQGSWTNGGSWAETYAMGDHGSNIQSALIADLQDHGTPVTWLGQADKLIVKTLYAWGPPVAFDISSTPDTTSAQNWPNNNHGWDPINLSGTWCSNGCYSGNREINRVRFTRRYHVTFTYNTVMANNSSSAPGVVLADHVGGPTGGCSDSGLTGGDSIYTHVIDPGP